MLIVAMADDDHQKIAETVLKLARGQLQENGALDFTVLTLDEQGREGRIDIDPEFFRRRPDTFSPFVSGTAMTPALRGRFTPLLWR
jgi:hypothetical protein